MKREYVGAFRVIEIAHSMTNGANEEFSMDPNNNNNNEPNDGQRNLLLLLFLFIAQLHNAHSYWAFAVFSNVRCSMHGYDCNKRIWRRQNEVNHNGNWLLLIKHFDAHRSWPKAENFVTHSSVCTLYVCVVHQSTPRTHIGTLQSQHLPQCLPIYKHIQIKLRRYISCVWQCDGGKLELFAFANEEVLQTIAHHGIWTKERSRVKLFAFTFETMRQCWQWVFRKTKCL